MPAPFYPPRGWGVPMVKARGREGFGELLREPPRLSFRPTAPTDKKPTDARELRELRARHTTHHGDSTTTPLSPPPQRNVQGSVHNLDHATLSQCDMRSPSFSLPFTILFFPWRLLHFLAAAPFPGGRADTDREDGQAGEHVHG